MISNSRAMVVIETASLPELLASSFNRIDSGIPFVTNSVGCRLEREIENIDPITILTIGDEGLLRVSGERKSERRAGIWMQVTHYRGYPLLVLPNFSTDLIYRDHDKEEFFHEIVDDFVKVWQYSLSHTVDETWRYARP